VTNRILVSFVLATKDRRESLLETLAQIGQCGLQRDSYEIIVADNDSSDGSSAAGGHLVDEMIRLPTNHGSCAKAFAAERSRGEYLMFLDDDSFPHPGSMTRMLERFEERPDLGAAGFAVYLPDGRQEASALPGVFHGCGVGFRASAYREVGGLDRTFFMQAEEYDLSFRLANAGWTIEIFDDLRVEHRKTAQARQAERTTYHDIRNNLRVAARYLPSAYYRPYRQDWICRYAWLAERLGHQRSFARGYADARWTCRKERWHFRHRRLEPAPLERFFGWATVEERMKRIAGRGVERVVFADLGKNIFAFVRAAARSGVQVLAIGDDRFAAPRRFYRGIPVISLEEALSLQSDAIVISNTAPLFAKNAYDRVIQSTAKPVFSWFQGPSRNAHEALACSLSPLATCP